MDCAVDEDKLKRHDLSDAEWARLEPLLPCHPHQGHRALDQHVGLGMRQRLLPRAGAHGEDSAMAGHWRILREDVRRDPFTGIGKPEPLRYHLPGAWSRRIDDEHRLVYIVTEAEIIILAARYHY